MSRVIVDLQMISPVRLFSLRADATKRRLANGKSLSLDILSHFIIKIQIQELKRSFNYFADELFGQGALRGQNQSAL